MWGFLFFSLAVSVATRQLIWLMVVIAMGGLITDRKAVLSTDGMKRAAIFIRLHRGAGIYQPDYVR